MGVANVPVVEATPQQSTPLLNIPEEDDEDFERLRPPGSVKIENANKPAQPTPQQLEFLKQMRRLITEVQKKEADRIQSQQAEERQRMEQALIDLNKDMQRPVPESKSLKPKIESWLTSVHPDPPTGPKITDVPGTESDHMKPPEVISHNKSRLMELARSLQELDRLQETRLHYLNTQREVIQGIHDEYRDAIYQTAEDEQLDVISLQAIERSVQSRLTASIVVPRRDPTDTDPSVESVAASAAGTWFGLGKGSMYDEVMTDADVSIGEANDGEPLQPHIKVPITQYLNDNQRSSRKLLAKIYGKAVVENYGEAFRRLQIFPKSAKMEDGMPPTTLNGITVEPSITVPASTPPISLATREAPSGLMGGAAGAGALLALESADPSLGSAEMSDDAVIDGPGFDLADDDGRSVTGSGLGPVDVDDTRSEVSGFSDQGDVGMSPGNPD